MRSPRPDRGEGKRRAIATEGEVAVRLASREELEGFAAKEWQRYNAEVGVTWDSRRYYLLAEVGGLPVGLAAFHLVGGVGHLDQLLVAKECRGRGLGSRLLREFERLCRAEGCHKLTLETAEYQARAFYERHGFKVACALRDNKFHYDWHLMEKGL
ncbi:MAG: GNAT family N-acetyltransferase [Candidatus Acetothermia bacterium]|nr:GNAT family N-acetyltransferase [Candidatus Acetothermia bacterium]MDH7505247.1 GNAT family N-acetyltransferase [Candidatus Acetothermia bacterium]